MLAEGEVDPSPLLTGTVGLDGVAGAFTALATPDTHAKILIDPRAGAPGVDSDVRSSQALGEPAPSIGA